ncbi:MAG: preprotein translocase subunit SecE [Candidatus Tritonobacter lacicola]|nr:preprotein translocase subunit SecE [Candidatus Tritonobacter lacicola]
MLKKALKFLKEVRAELDNVTWPVKRGRGIKLRDRFKELSDSTMVVIVSTIIMALYLGFVNWALANPGFGVITLLLRF